MYEEFYKKLFYFELPWNQTIVLVRLHLHFVLGVFLL